MPCICLCDKFIVRRLVMQRGHIHAMILSSHRPPVSLFTNSARATKQHSTTLRTKCDAGYSSKGQSLSKDSQTFEKAMY